MKHNVSRWFRLPQRWHEAILFLQLSFSKYLSSVIDDLRWLHLSLLEFLLKQDVCIIRCINVPKMSNRVYTNINYVCGFFFCSCIHTNWSPWVSNPKGVIVHLALIHAYLKYVILSYAVGFIIIFCTLWFFNSCTCIILYIE